jgi:tight adherence protein B
MSSSAMLAALLVGAGLAAVVVGVLLRGRERTEELVRILDLPFGERDVPVEAITEKSALVEGTVGLAGRMVRSVDTRGSLAESLERAQIPMKPGEYVVFTICAAIVTAALLVAVTEQWLFAVIGVGAAIGAAYAAPNFLIGRRRKAFEEQLPDALSLIAGSLSAGHTFLRSIQMMCEESEPPLSEEFRRVVNETQLGDPLVDALERMARRLDIKDLIWVVQAIRIQQTVGGKLADLLHTLADFIRAREEIRREVRVLTAEGRISAWILGGLPVFLLLAIQTSSPKYMAPMFEGWGIAVLAATGVSVAIGVGIILRMVKIDV